jgi:transposase
MAVVELIGATTTKTGLKVECALDERTYHKGIRIKNAEMKLLDCPPSALLRQFRGFRNGGFLDHRSHHGAQMRQKSGPEKAPAEQVVKDIRRATRRQFSAEEKIRIVLEGVRGEESIAELCRREGIASSMYYGWSKEFLDAGKRRLAGDTTRAATSDEVKDLRREAQALKEAVADLTLENRLLKKSMLADGEDEA